MKASNLSLSMSVLCKTCGKQGKVVDSRRHGETIWRRRECCGDRWTTIEGGSNEELRALRAKVEQYRTMIAGIRSALGGRE
jgi:transcriptional regulator NrdR family protein